MPHGCVNPPISVDGGDVLESWIVYLERPVPAEPPNYEALRAFYLGNPYDLAERNRLNNIILYDSRDLVTHAVIVGMTGSGKTGLGVGLLEEAAIDGIPALIIDPKGDLANLLLNFPELRPEDFQPWIHTSDAQRQEMNVERFPDPQYRIRPRETRRTRGQDAKEIRQQDPHVGGPNCTRPSGGRTRAK